MAKDRETETKTVETDKGLAGTKQKETTQTERESDKSHHPEPDQSGVAPVVSVTS